MIKIFIKQVKMQGFKDHKEKVTFKFFPFTTIYGDNGKGKSTIGDAISWCLCTANYNGKEKITKELTNMHSKKVEVSVTADIITDNGIETKEFKRINGAGKDYDGFFVNGVKNPSQYVLSSLLNIDKDLFFSMLNPLYFSSLSGADAKNTILKVIKKIEDEEVLNSMEQYQRDLLINSGFKNNINNFITVKKDDIKHMEEDKIYFQGSIDAKNIKTEIPNVNIDLLKTESQKIYLDIVEIEKTIKQEYIKEFKNQKLKEEKIQEINNLQQQLATVSAQSSNSEITKLQGEIDYYKKYPMPQIPQMQNVTMLKKQVQQLRNKYSEINTQIQHLQNMKVTCNKCGNEIILPNQQKQLLLQNINEVKQNGITVGQNLKKLEQTNAEVQKQYEDELKKSKQFVANEIQKREKQITKLKADGENPQITSVKNQISSAQNELKIIENKLQEEKNQRNKNITVFDQKLKEKQEEKQSKDIEIVNYNSLLTLEANRIKDLKKFEGYAEKNEKDLVHVNDALNAAKTFSALRIKLQKAEFEKYLDKIDISLEKVVKSTGELKEDFNINYEGKEFNLLSASEKIKAGLELVNMFTKLKNIYLPTIIDNAESITKYESIKESQTIEMKVKENSELMIVKETFKDWLLSKEHGYLNEGTSLSNLVKFINNTADFPNTISYNELLGYLVQKDGYEEILEIFKCAYVKYKCENMECENEENRSVS